MLSESSAQFQTDASKASTRKYKSMDCRKIMILLFLAIRRDYGATVQDIQNEFIQKYAWATDYTKGLKHTLDNLEKAKCVECYTYNKRTRIYKVSEFGIKAVDVIYKERNSLSFLDCFGNLDSNSSV